MKNKQKTTKKTQKRKTEKSKLKNKKIKNIIIFSIISFLIFLIGLLTVCLTFENHSYYENLLQKYKIEKNDLEIEKINNQYLNLLNDLNQDQNLYDFEIVKNNSNESFENYLQSYLLYLSENKKVYKNITDFFIVNYLNNNANTGFQENMLNNFSSLKKYAFLNFNLDNNQNAVVPNNAGFISGLFLISLGSLSFLIFLVITLKFYWNSSLTKKKD